MSDRIPASIWIGGKLRREDLESFLQVLRETGAMLEWASEAFSPETENDLRDAVKNGVDNVHLRLMDEEATGGMFHELEDFCEKHGLPYDRQSDAKWEFESEIVKYRPGEKTFVANCTQGGDVLVPVSEIIRLFGMELEKLRKCAEHMKDSFYKLCGLHVADLEPFYVED